MPRLAPISRRDLVRRLHEFGFDGPYEGGKHPYMIKDDLVLTIPNPHGETIGVDLLIQILQRAKISRGEWLDVK